LYKFHYKIILIDLMKNFFVNEAKIILLLIIIMASSPKLFAYQSDQSFDSLITRGIHQIYNIKFESADSIFTKVREVYPEHPSGYFFDAMILWWKIMLDTSNEEIDDMFADKLEWVIEFCDEILDRDPNNIDAMFFKGGALGFRGRLYAFRQSWFNAALDGKDALPIVHQAYAADSTNPDIQLGFGIYNYYAAVVPEQYPAVKPFMILFPEGNKNAGLEQLKYVAENGKYAKVESQYFLATSFYSFENDYANAINQISKLTETFPDNPRFLSLHGRIWVRRNNYNEAAKVFKIVVEKNSLNMPGFNDRALREATYYIGVNYERKGLIDSSLTYFELCENISKKIDEDEESGFLINAALYLAKFYERKKELTRALEKYEEVLDYREYKNSHYKAERAIERIEKLVEN
jgi:tetratricopeptide (TPR) repeat protein